MGTDFAVELAVLIRGADTFAVVIAAEDVTVDDADGITTVDDDDAA